MKGESEIGKVEFRWQKQRTAQGSLRQTHLECLLNLFLKMQETTVREVCLLLLMVLENEYFVKIIKTVKSASSFCFCMSMCVK